VEALEYNGPVPTRVSRSRLLCAALIAAGLAVPPAVAAQKPGSQVKTAPAPHKPAASKPAPHKDGTSGGKLIVRYAALKDRQYARFEAMFRKAANIEASVDDINDELRLPRNVLVSLEECGEVNSFYDPDTHKLSLCYELAKDMERLFKPDADNKEDLQDMVLAGMEFIFHHELGHALVDLYDLPVVGREEDAVDELATLIYIRTDDEATALIAAEEFLDEGVEEAEDEENSPAYWDEHSLSTQRFYNIACLVVGSDPDKHKDLLKEFPELEERDCEAEFDQKDRAWDKLLSPYFRK
jgi:hypothetical protein